MTSLFFLEKDRENKGLWEHAVRSNLVLEESKACVKLLTF